MSNLPPLLAMPIALALAACASGAPLDPIPSPDPSATADGSVVEHATGATDLILRMETGGGFVAPGTSATQAPSFSLYGDGTLIARDDNAPWPDPGPDGLMRLVPFFRVKLDEGQVQRLLLDALGEGGLGIARLRYEAGGVADAPTTFFTVKAGGLDKTVEVDALGMETEGGPDALVRKAFSALADRLRAIAADLPAAAEAYVPGRWRGVLLEAGIGGASAPVAWPWPGLTPADFTQAVPDGVQFASRVLSTDEVDALGLGDLGGGIQNVSLLSSDGQTGFTLALRPLFPDERG